MALVLKRALQQSAGIINPGFIYRGVPKQRGYDNINTYSRHISQLVNPNARRVCLVDTLALRALQQSAGIINPGFIYRGVPKQRGYDNINTYSRHISQLVNPNARRVCLVDTLALVRSLEAQGFPSKQAEAITSSITEVLNDSLESVSETFVSKADMEKTMMLQEAHLSKFKSEVQISQEHHFSMLQRETEKLRTDIDKMRSELRYEIDKVTAGHRLDLNLEKGRIRDVMNLQNAETTGLTNKLDQEIHGLRAQLEAAKYDVIKYCIGTLTSISAIGLAFIRIFM